MKRIYFFILNFVVISNSLFSQEIPTRGEIFNFDIGDIFHYEKYSQVEFGGGERFEDITIVGKYYSADNDTVFYETERITWFMNHDYFSDTVYISHFYDEPIIMYENLYDTIVIDTAYIDSEMYNGRMIYDYYLFWWDSMVQHDWIYSYEYVIGCGMVHKNETEPEMLNFRIEKSDLIYYKKGDEEWGEQIPWHVGIDDVTFENKVVVFPNPASDFVNLKAKDFSNIYIYNSTGQLILSRKSDSDNTQLDVSAFPAGVYFVNLIDEDGLIVGKSKFLKR